MKMVPIKESEKLMIIDKMKFDHELFGTEVIKDRLPVVLSLFDLSGSEKLYMMSYITYDGIKFYIYEYDLKNVNIVTHKFVDTGNISILMNGITKKDVEILLKEDMVDLYTTITEGGEWHRIEDQHSISIPIPENAKQMIAITPAATHGSPIVKFYNKENVNAIDLQHATRIWLDEDSVYNSYNEKVHIVKYEIRKRFENDIQIGLSPSVYSDLYKRTKVYLDSDKYLLLNQEIFDRIRERETEANTIYKTKNLEAIMLGPDNVNYDDIGNVFFNDKWRTEITYNVGANSLDRVCFMSPFGIIDFMFKSGKYKPGDTVTLDVLEAIYLTKHYLKDNKTIPVGWYEDKILVLELEDSIYNLIDKLQPLK